MWIWSVKNLDIQKSDNEFEARGNCPWCCPLCPCYWATSSIESKPPGGYQRGGGLARPFGAWPEAGENHLDFCCLFWGGCSVVQELTPTEGGTNFEETDKSVSFEVEVSNWQESSTKIPEKSIPLEPTGCILYIINMNYPGKFSLATLYPELPRLSPMRDISALVVSQHLIRFTGNGRWATFDVVSLWCKNLFESNFLISMGQWGWSYDAMAYNI